MELHRAIFDENQRRIAQSVAGYTDAFLRYEREYAERVTHYQRRATFDELDRRVREADVVYVGDYHTLSQSQRGFLRMLRRAPTERSLVIALEFLRIRHQKAVDAYLNDALEESAFLEAIGYDPEGGSGDWFSFKPIFDFAKEHGHRVVGLDTVGRGPDSPLVNRDRSAARVIAKELVQEPSTLVFALVGELHAAPDHLPQRVHEELQSRSWVHEPLVVYQNCHEIYWQIAERGLEHEVDLVRIARGEYYLLNTLPIVAQQSFLNWIEQDDDAQIEAPEATFVEYAEVIAEFFDLELGDALDEVEVTTIVDLSFLQRIQRRGDFSASDVRKIRNQILNSESYFIPRANMVYLGNLSVNHTAEEASHFLRAVCSGSHEPRLLVDAFYARTMEEAVGFLGSKLLNHKRRAPGPKELERRSKSRRLDP
ncbi:MAG: ChaN family lipoprotein, partial [Myxococcota bacterium]